MYQIKIKYILKELRHNKQWTLDELAKKFLEQGKKITKQVLSNYETGKSEPDLETICMFADIYNRSIEYIIIGQTNDMSMVMEPSEAELKLQTCLENNINLKRELNMTRTTVKSLEMVLELIGKSKDGE